MKEKLSSIKNFLNDLFLVQSHGLGYMEPTSESNNVVDIASTAEIFGIGVDSANSVQVYLPQNPKNGQEVYVKMEMADKPRTITILTDDETLIDGKKKLVIKKPFEKLHIIFFDNQWHIKK